MLSQQSLERPAASFGYVVFPRDHCLAHPRYISFADILRPVHLAVGRDLLPWVLPSSLLLDVLPVHPLALLVVRAPPLGVCLSLRLPPLELSLAMGSPCRSSLLFCLQEMQDAVPPKALGVKDLSHPEFLLVVQRLEIERKMVDRTLLACRCREHLILWHGQQIWLRW